jgi:hypothetical protein
MIYDLLDLCILFLVNFGEIYSIFASNKKQTFGFDVKNKITNKKITCSAITAG